MQQRATAASSTVSEAFRIEVSSREGRERQPASTPPEVDPAAMRM